MSPIRLIAVDPALEAAWSSDPGYTEAMAREDWAGVAERVRQLVGPELMDYPADVDRPTWGGYLAVDTDTQSVVGSCAFKDAPSPDGVVEVAYFTYPGCEGRGFATSMASMLIELAWACIDVRQVIAHTLPEASASTRVLEKVGMSFVGEVIDPEDGPVWRWQKPVRR